MRFRPLLSTFFYSLNNLARRQAPPRISSFAALRPLNLRSMSGIPFLGALFGSSSSSKSNMSYPDKRSDDEWRAVLNKGPYLIAPNPAHDGLLTVRQSSSAFFAKRAPRPPAPATLTSTTPRRASTHARAARLRSTRPTTSSSRAAAGPATLTACLAP